MLYKTTILSSYVRIHLHFLYMNMAMKGIIKHSMIWIQVIAPIVIIKGNVTIEIQTCCCGTEVVIENDVL